MVAEAIHDLETMPCCRCGEFVNDVDWQIDVLWRHLRGRELQECCPDVKLHTFFDPHSRRLETWGYVCRKCSINFNANRECERLRIARQRHNRRSARAVTGHAKRNSETKIHTGSANRSSAQTPPDAECQRCDVEDACQYRCCSCCRYLCVSCCQFMDNPDGSLGRYCSVCFPSASDMMSSGDERKLSSKVLRPGIQTGTWVKATTS